MCLIRARQRFVLHAPRRTDETSTLIVPRDPLNRGAARGFRSVGVNVEAGRAARGGTARGMRSTLSRPAAGARLLGGGFPRRVRRGAARGAVRAGPDAAPERASAAFAGIGLGRRCRAGR